MKIDVVLVCCYVVASIFHFTRRRKAMKSDLYTLGKKLLIFFLFATFVAVALAVIYLDISVFKPEMSEDSNIEMLQEGILIVTVLMYGFMAKKDLSMRPALLLAGGFFACMFIREWDSVFTRYGLHWLPFALAVTAACIFYAARNLERAVRGMVRFAETQPFMMIMVGVVTILLFSRIFGMSVLWQSLLGDSYERWVKTFAEESLELFGYVQCFTGTLLYMLSSRKQRA